MDNSNTPAIMKGISNALGVAPLHVELHTKELQTVATQSPDEHVLTPAEQESDDDFRHAREVLIEIVESGRSMLDIAARAAVSGQQPRQFEVASKLLADLTAANKSLLELHESRRTLVPEAEPTPAATINNNTIVVGSAAELLELVETRRKASKLLENKLVDE